MLQKFKKICRPTAILMMIGFSISFTSVLIGINSVDSVLSSINSMNSDSTPIYSVMENTGMTLALKIYLFSIADCLVTTNYWIITKHREMAIRKAFGWSNMQLAALVFKEMGTILLISMTDGVDSSGRFDQTGEFFDELKDKTIYQQMNKEILRDADSKYLNVPGITRIMYADEAVLKLIKGISVHYDDIPGNMIPLYISETFKELLPEGTKITSERTREVYQVKGYLPKFLKGFNENDLIRFPIISLDGFFIAPFPPSRDLDVMSQLSCLHNTYVFLNTHADVQEVKQALSDLAQSYGFKVSGTLLSEEYEMYCKETNTLVKNQILLAVFISIMAITSVIAVFTANTILKKRQYGILLANGFTKKDLASVIALEIFVIVLFSGLLSWLIKLQEILTSKSLGISLFRDVLLTAHIHFTLPLCGMVCAGLIILSVLLPAINLFRYC